MDGSLQKKRRMLQLSDCYRGLGVQTLSASDESDNSESEDEVLVGEEGLEEVDESAVEKLIKSALEQSR